MNIHPYCRKKTVRNSLRTSPKINISFKEENNFTYSNFSFSAMRIQLSTSISLTFFIFLFVVALQIFAFSPKLSANDENKINNEWIQKDKKVFCQEEKTFNTSNNVFIDKSVKDFPNLQEDGQTLFHLISHGKPAYLLIEGEWKKPFEIVEWLKAKDLLKGKNHLNIYGCNFAKGKKGRAAVEYLEAALGISIAASNDITGVDGDWELEVGESIGSLSFQDYAYSLQTCSGNASTLVEVNNVIDDFKILGAPNNEGAIIGASSPVGYATVDLEDMLLAGESITMTWAAVSAGLEATVEVSTDNITYVASHRQSL